MGDVEVGVVESRSIVGSVLGGWLGDRITHPKHCCTAGNVLGFLLVKILLGLRDVVNAQVTLRNGAET